MAYELTETEKRLGAIPGQMTGSEQMVSGSERRTRAIAADRPAYTPQFGPQGAVSQTPERQIEQADVRQQAITGAFKPNQMVSANIEKQYGSQGELLGYTGRGTGRPSLDQQERNVEMAGRGMVRDPYGNWMPPGGWGAQAPAAQARTGYFDSPAMNEEAPVDFSRMTLGEGFAKAGAMGRQTRKERQAATEAGAMQRLGITEAGAMSRTEREAALRREAAGEERAAGEPYREAQIGALKGQTALTGTQRELAELEAFEPRAKVSLMKQLERKDLPVEDRAKLEAALKEINERVMRQKIAIEVAKQKAAAGEEVEFAEGGLVRGYADGGAVGRDLAQPAPQVNPLIAQYGQYLTAAASAGVPPVPFAQYQNLLQTTRASVQGQPPVGFADGGDVSALGRTLEGPGTGTSDSIPAVIDGQTPAALSKDEFVFPAEVTKYYGTKFMNDLIAKAKAALSGEGATANG